MQRKDVTTRVGIAAITLASMGWSETASAISYTTVGSVAAGIPRIVNDGVLVGPAVIGVAGVTNGSFNLPGSIALGSLVVTPSADGAASTYSKVPFTLAFEAPEFDRAVGSGDNTTVYQGVFTLTGHLDGTVQANGQADVTATIDGFSPWGINPLIPEWHYLNDLPFPTSDLTAGPTFHLTTPSGGGSMAISVQVVPEPSTVAFAVVGIAGLILRRRLIRRA